jgi:8-oxo-dGTP diphosphatase
MAKNDPKTAAKAVIYSKGKYLLLFRGRGENISPSSWDIPGGGMEKGETAAETLIREVKEETGIDISSSKIFPIKEWNMDKDGIKIGGTDFLCSLDDCQEAVLSAEHIRAQWFSKEEIMNSEEIPTWLKESVELASARLKSKTNDN